MSLHDCTNNVYDKNKVAFLDLELEMISDQPIIDTAIKHFSLKKDSSDSLHDFQASTELSLKCSSEAAKTASTAIRLISWTAGMRVSVWAFGQLFKSIRFCMLMGGPSHREKSLVDKNLDKLTGSIHLSKMLHSLSPVIAGAIRDQLISLQLHGAVDSFIKGEGDSLHALVDGLLPTIYNNLVMHAQKKQELSVEDVTISFADVISSVCEIFDRHASYINQRLVIIENAPDGEKRDRIIRHIFSGLVEDLILAAFPKGVKELPLSKIPLLSDRYWKILKENVLPLLVFKLYRQFVSPMHESKKDILLQRTGGESLVSLAEMASKEMTGALPSLLLGADEVPKHPLLMGISNSLCSLIKGSKHLHSWLANWFTRELVGVCQSDNQFLKKIWELVGGYVEPLLIHVFVSMSDTPVNLASNNAQAPDVFGIITVRLLSLCSSFFNEYKTKLEMRFEQLKQEAGSYKEDEELLTIFKILADRLICFMGLDDPSKLPLPDFIKEVVVEQIRKAAPGFLLRQYVAITNHDIDDHQTRNKLRKELFDPKLLKDPALALQVISALQSKNPHEHPGLSKEFNQVLWQESGTELKAKVVETICKKTAEDLTNVLMKQCGVSDQEELNTQTNPFMNRVQASISFFLEHILIEVTVNILSTHKGKDLNLTPLSVALHVHQLISQRLDEIDVSLDEIAKTFGTSTETYRIEAGKLFIGLANDLCQMSGVNPFAHLPLSEFKNSDAIKEKLWQSLQTVFLPGIISRAYSDMKKWQFDLSASYKELNKSYHTSHPKWACKVLAQYSTDYLRHYLQNSGQNIAGLLHQNLIEHLKFPEEDFKVTGFDETISKNLRFFVQNHETENIWPALTLYMEAIFAKFLAGISKTIHEVELTTPDLNIDIAIQILKEIATHFSIIARTTEKVGAQNAYKVPLSEMLAAFAEELHKGVPLNPDVSEEEKNRVRLQGCFIPLSSKLMALSGLTIDDFPLPTAIRQLMGEVIVHHILPMILMNAFQKAQEPQVRNAMMLDFLDTLYLAFNAIELQKREEAIKEASAQLAPKHKDLLETCGHVVLELIKLIPDTSLQYVFMKEKVKNMSAEAVGDALMPYLTRWTLLKMVDSAIYGGLPSFHASKWEGKLDYEELVPRQAFVRPDGKMELKPVKDFKFIFPVTPSEIRESEKEKDLKVSEVERQLKELLSQTINQQMYAKCWELIKSLWTNLQDHLNDFFERLFPEDGLRVKGMLDNISGKIFFDFFGVILLFLFSPLISLIKYLTEKTVVDKRSEDIIQNLDSKTMENLFYKWTDILVDTLVSKQQQPGISGMGKT